MSEDVCKETRVLTTDCISPCIQPENVILPWSFSRWDSSLGGRQAQDKGKLNLFSCKATFQQKFSMREITGNMTLY